MTHEVLVAFQSLTHRLNTWSIGVNGLSSQVSVSEPEKGKTTVRLPASKSVCVEAGRQTRTPRSWSRARERERDAPLEEASQTCASCSKTALDFLKANST